MGLNPEWKVRTRAEHIEKGKIEALGVKGGINPALIKDVPDPFGLGVKGTFLGGELDARLNTNEIGVKALGYGGKFDRSLDFVPIVGKYCKASGYVCAAGGKAVIDWEKGTGTVGAAALFGASVEVNWKYLAIDAYNAVSGWFKGTPRMVQEYVMDANVFFWMMVTNIEQDHNTIRPVSNCHISRGLANSNSFLLATDTIMNSLSNSEDRFDMIWMILDVSRTTVGIDSVTKLVERYVGL